MNHLGIVRARYVLGGAVFKDLAEAVAKLEKYLGNPKTALPIIEGKIACAAKSVGDTTMRCLSTTMLLRDGRNIVIYRNDFEEGFVTLRLASSSAPAEEMLTNQLAATRRQGYRSLVSAAAIVPAFTKEDAAEVDLTALFIQCDEGTLGGNTPEYIAQQLVFNKTGDVSVFLLAHMKDVSSGAWYSVVCEIRHISSLSIARPGVLAVRRASSRMQDVTVQITFYPSTQASPRPIESVNRDLAKFLQKQSKLARDAMRATLE